MAEAGDGGRVLRSTQVVRGCSHDRRGSTMSKYLVKGNDDGDGIGRRR
jgi:hypothetical protein